MNQNEPGPLLKISVSPLIQFSRSAEAVIAATRVHGRQIVERPLDIEVSREISTVFPDE